MGTDYDNGLIVGTLIGKEISGKSDDFSVGSTILSNYLKWDTHEEIVNYPNHPVYPSIVFCGGDSEGSSYYVATAYVDDKDITTVYKVSLSGGVVWSRELNGYVYGGVYTDQLVCGNNCVFDKYDNFYIATEWAVPLLPIVGGNNCGIAGVVSVVNSSGGVSTYAHVGHCTAIAIDELNSDIYLAFSAYDQRDPVGYKTYNAVYRYTSSFKYIWQYTLASANSVEYGSVISSITVVNPYVLPLTYDKRKTTNVLIVYNQANTYIESEGKQYTTFVRLDANGHPITKRSDEYYCRNICSDLHGNYYITWGRRTYTSESAYTQNGVVSKYNLDDALQWEWGMERYLPVQVSVLRPADSALVNILCIVTSAYWDSIGSNTNVNSNTLVDPASMQTIYSIQNNYAVCGSIDRAGNCHTYHLVDPIEGVRTIRRIAACDHFVIIGPQQDPNFIILLNGYTDSSYKIIMELLQGRFYTEVNNTNARVIGLLRLSGEWPHISYSFGPSVSPTVHTDIQLAINRREVITISVISRNRIDAYDHVGLTLNIENNTIYPIEFTVQDDPNDPRFVLGEVTGSNTNVTIL